jgi:hypothetical protein
MNDAKNRNACRLFVLLACLCAMCVSCVTTGLTTATEQVIEAQTESAITTAKIETLADSATQDAEKLVEVAKSTGDATIIYVAEKHATEVKKISENAKAQAVSETKARAALAKTTEAIAVQEQKTADIKTELEVVKAKSSARLFIIITALVGLLIFLAIRFWSVLKNVFPFNLFIH